MARRKILEYPDPRLRAPSRPVTAFDEDLARLVDDLLETLYATRGIGLAAAQVDDQRAVLVMDLSGDATEPQVFVNPEIVSQSAPALVEESCLSVPDLVGNVIRPTDLIGPRLSDTRDAVSLRLTIQEVFHRLRSLPRGRHPARSSARLDRPAL